MESALREAGPSTKGRQVLANVLDLPSGKRSGHNLGSGVSGVLSQRRSEDSTLSLAARGSHETCHDHFEPRVCLYLKPLKLGGSARAMPAARRESWSRALPFQAQNRKQKPR